MAPTATLTSAQQARLEQIKRSGMHEFFDPMPAAVQELILTSKVPVAQALLGRAKQVVQAGERAVQRLNEQTERKQRAIFAAPSEEFTLVVNAWSGRRSEARSAAMATYSKGGQQREH